MGKALYGFSGKQSMDLFLRSARRFCYPAGQGFWLSQRLTKAYGGVVLRGGKWEEVRKEKNVWSFQERMTDYFSFYVDTIDVVPPQRDVQILTCKTLGCNLFFFFFLGES